MVALQLCRTTSVGERGFLLFRSPVESACLSSLVMVTTVEKYSRNPASLCWEL